jgi:hypothetical protein
VIRFPAGVRYILYSTAFRPPLGFTQPLIRWVLGVIYSGVNQLVCEADHSPTSNIKVKNGGVVAPIHHTSSSHGASLISTGMNLPF